MSWKSITAAVVLACLPIPVAALEPLRAEPHTMFFIKVPLDGRSPREQMASWGFSVRGSKEYQVFSVDNHAMRSFAQMGLIESKFLIVGAVVAAGAVVVASSGSKSAAQQQQQQQEAAAQQAAQQQRTASQPPAAPCSQKP